eukprot:COSAG04_NODE_11155_length_727_cov_1.498408_2_plen_66_part_01
MHRPVGVTFDFCKDLANLIVDQRVKRETFVLAKQRAIEPRLDVTRVRMEQNHIDVALRDVEAAKRR